MSEYLHHFFWAGSGLVYTLFSVPLCIRFLKRNNIVQKVRSDGPPAHLAKSSTPTMGGLVFLLPILVFFGYEWYLRSPQGILLALSGLFGFLLGSLDDELKYFSGTRGLPARYRLFLYIVFGAGLSYFRYLTGSSVESLPILGRTFFLEQGIFFFLSLYFGLLVSGINFTDGLDGLLCGNYAIILPVFAVAMSPDSLKTGIWLLFGLCAGFLFYNVFPAQVFLGEVGSQTLAFFLSSAVVLSGQEIPFILMGSVFFVEALSVMLQVASYRATGKRIFRMTPIHHHFELLGWPEPKVVVRFWIFTACASFLTVVLVRQGWV
ncbi:MAG: phospho-N-acetylmuramoyl-pentapeptide-transferase [bacterium JZ-2024 1]